MTFKLTLCIPEQIFNVFKQTDVPNLHQFMLEVYKNSPKELCDAGLESTAYTHLMVAPTHLS